MEVQSGKKRTRKIGARRRQRCPLVFRGMLQSRSDQILRVLHPSRSCRLVISQTASLRYHLCAETSHHSGNRFSPFKTSHGIPWEYWPTWFPREHTVMYPQYGSFERARWVYTGHPFEVKRVIAKGCYRRQHRIDDKDPSYKATARPDCLRDVPEWEATRCCGLNLQSVQEQ